jgi:hypothetical protein
MGNMGLTYSSQSSVIPSVLQNVKIRTCKSVILSALMSHVKEGTHMERFKNMVLTRIFGPEKDEVTGEWRKLHHEEDNNFYTSDIIRKTEGRDL